MKEGEPKLEEEKSPEKIVDNAVSAIENKDAADSVISSQWMDNAKGYAKTTGKVAGISLGLGLILTGKILYGVFKLAKKAIEKKGKIGFSEGYEIGNDIFSFESKKEKK